LAYCRAVSNREDVDMKIFGEGDLRASLEGRLGQLRSEVHAEPANRLLNVNEAEYVEYLVRKYEIDPLMLLWDDLTITDREQMLRGEVFPQDFDVHAGKSYPKQVITYHLPFTGERDLLNMTPSTRILYAPVVEVSGATVSFDVVNWRDDPEDIKRQANEVLNAIRSQAANVSREVEEFNQRLPEAAQAVVTERKKQHLDRANLMQGLDVPVRHSDKTPETFAVPTVKRRIVVKPTSPDTAFAPEPTLDAALYADILRICRETGVEMERHPRVYADKDEETLRDHFIMVLSPHFDSVTGEPFNRSGKTDILIRHESANVFVAECKFWAGSKAFTKTIDQVLDYLTWRDSKAALLLFVRNKELTPILAQIAPTVEQHPCYVSVADAVNGEDWLNFNLRLPNDSTRGIRLAVLAFHLPPQHGGPKTQA
jgi:hypothetical protein